MEYKLKDCPFCGSEGLINKLSNIYQDVYKITCSGENDNSCAGLTLEGYTEDKIEATEAWNKRFKKPE